MFPRLKKRHSKKGVLSRLVESGKRKEKGSGHIAEPRVNGELDEEGFNQSAREGKKKGKGRLTKARSGGLLSAEL